jgi:diguanylate cyclase (GGDEF)-like protein
MKIVFTSIKSRLLLLFIVFSVVPMGFVASHVYNHAEKLLTISTVDHLEQISRHREEEILEFFEQNRVNLISAQNFVNFRTNIPTLVRLSAHPADARYLAAKKLLDSQLIQFAQDHHLGDIDIISPVGTLVYSTDMDRHEHESYANDAVFVAGKKGIYFSDIIHKRDKFAIMASAPLFDLDNTMIGVIAFELETGHLFAMLRDSTGLGKTGETLIGKKIGDAVVFLNPLRHDADATLKRTVKLGATAFTPIERAATGMNGTGLAIDYRDREVLAVWRYIPSLKWGIVTKIDAAEAFAAISELRRDMLTAGTLAMVLGIGLSLWLAHSLTRPIRALKEGAKQLGQGNLDYRVEVSGNDEIGALAGKFNQMAANLKEITESHALINHKANHDPLTGLPNRLLLLDRLEQAVFEYSRENSMFGLMFLDLDGFKGVNDAYGHDVGDILLKQVADRLCWCVRQIDTVARIGGDEFVIILLKIKESDNIAAVARKILATIQEDFTIAGVTLRIGVSIGASMAPRDGLEPETLMQLADEAMYQAKKAGKNTFRLTAKDENQEVRPHVT